MTWVTCQSNGNADFWREMRDVGRETVLLNVCLGLLASLAEGDLDVHLPLIANHGHRHRVSSLVLVQYCNQVLLIGDFFAIDGDDEVSAKHDRDVADVCPLVATA